MTPFVVSSERLPTSPLPLYGLAFDRYSGLILLAVGSCSFPTDEN